MQNRTTNQITSSLNNKQFNITVIIIIIISFSYHVITTTVLFNTASTIGTLGKKKHLSNLVVNVQCLRPVFADQPRNNVQLIIINKL